MRIISAEKDFFKPACAFRTVSVARRLISACLLKIFISCCKMRLSLSDPKALIQGEGVIAMGNLFRQLFKKIVESVIVRIMYDWLKHLFDEDDDDLVQTALNRSATPESLLLADFSGVFAL